MRTVTFITASLLLAASATAQAPTIGTTGHEDRNVPARNVDEGAKRFAPAVRLDPSAYQDMPELDTSEHRSLPPGFRHQAVSYDCLTGVETYQDLYQPDPRAPQFVVGSTTRALVEFDGRDEIWPTPITQSSRSYPFSVQCRLFFSLPGGNYRCSGTLVGPKTVVTAGHCVHEGNGGVWATNMRVAPAWDGDDDKYSDANGVRLGSFNGWTASGSWDHDMGFVGLDRPVGFLAQWFGYGYTTTNSFWTDGTEDFYLIGYPGISNRPTHCTFSGAPDQLYQGSGYYDSAATYVITTRVSSGWCYSGGMSGAGIYYFDASNDRIVVGNHSHRDYGGTPYNTIGTCRMTSGKFTYLNGGFADLMYSDTELDLVPLDVNANVSPAAGSGLTTFNYLVGNASDVNPANATYSTDVYLSTNDNISIADTLIQTHIYTYDFGVRSTRNTNASSFIRVDPTTKPTIPMSTVPGTYWVGVIISGDHANAAANNDTDGWDAAEITVGGMFPYLPSSFLSVPSSGRVVTFEGLSSPSYFGVNRLHGETLAFSSDAWVNYGQLATCIDPFRGTRSLELGVNPASGVTNPDPIAALVIGFNATNGLDVVLDFEVKNDVDDDDPFDGVWISSDGQRWYQLLGYWGDLTTASRSWESIRDVQLTGATPVNTDNSFYLAFACQDNYPYGGGADGIGIDDIRLHPSRDPTFTVSHLYSPGTAQLHMHAMTPNDFGCIVVSGTGGGPVRTPIGTVLLSPPFITFGCGVLDRDGAKTFPWVVPGGYAGTPVWFQAFDFGTMSLTNGLGLRLK